MTSAISTTGIKGMKTTVTGAISSFFLGIFSFAISVPRTILSDIAAIGGIIVMVLTAIQLALNSRKITRENTMLDLEMDEFIMRKCNKCKNHENCVFTKEHRPASCKHRTTTE